MTEYNHISWSSLFLHLEFTVNVFSLFGYSVKLLRFHNLESLTTSFFDKNDSKLIT